jgi:hypothetical protein
MSYKGKIVILLVQVRVSERTSPSGWQELKRVAL